MFIKFLTDDRCYATSFAAYMKKSYIMTSKSLYSNEKEELFVFV